MQVCAAELVQVVNTSSHQYFDTATSVCHTKLVACFFQLPTDNAPAALLRLSCVGPKTISRVFVDTLLLCDRHHERQSSKFSALFARRKVPFQVKCVHVASFPPPSCVVFHIWTPALQLRHSLHQKGKHFFASSGCHQRLPY